MPYIHNVCLNSHESSFTEASETRWVKGRSRTDAVQVFYAAVSSRISLIIFIQPRADFAKPASLLTHSKLGWRWYHKLGHTNEFEVSDHLDKSFQVLKHQKSHEMRSKQHWRHQTQKFTDIFCLPSEVFLLLSVCQWPDAITSPTLYQMSKKKKKKSEV